jgi:hypothetical protein
MGGWEDGRMGGWEHGGNVGGSACSGTAFACLLYENAC